MAKAIIMAGGEGTRLRPMTCNRPKPMVPVANRPVIEHIIDLLKVHDIREIGITLQYLPEVIEAHLNEHSAPDIDIKYFVEETPMGTAGGVKNAAGFIDEDFIVISGDALTDMDLTKILEFHRNNGAIATLVLKSVTLPLEYGIVVTDPSGRIVRFLEKPSWGEVFSDTANTGIYVLSPAAMEYVNKGQIVDFSKDLFPLLLKEKKPLFGYISTDYWCDIGDPAAFIQANADVLAGKVRTQIPGKLNKCPDGNIWIGEGTEIEDGVIVEPPCAIGSRNLIKKGAHIGKYTVIGNNNVIYGQSSIKKSIIANNCSIGRKTEIRGSIICDKVCIKEGSSLFEHSIIGDNTVIREGAVVKPNIKIWPHKLVDRGMEVNSSLIWGSRYSRNIFGNRGVTGEVNIDITPEYASKLGASYGAVLGADSVIGISSDGTAASHMLKLSFTAGIMSAGAGAFDLGNLLLPVARSAVRFYGLKGGVHLTTSNEQPYKVFTDFLDSSGCNIDRNTERKIENLFIREDFIRSEAGKIRMPVSNPGFTDYYLRNIINGLNIKRLPFKIAVNTQSYLASDLITELLSFFGCDVESTRLHMMNVKTGNRSLASSDLHFFANQVRLQKLDLGVSLEDMSERMLLVDEKGRIVTEDMFTVIISVILFDKIKNGIVIVPQTASHIIEKLAESSNCRIIRVKSSARDLMRSIVELSKEKDSDMQFILNFDAFAGLVRILEYMAEKKLRLSDMVDSIPEFHLSKVDVGCPWEAKGRVLREIIQQQRFPAEASETAEGVRIQKEKGWVLLLPDAQEPVFRVISEGFSAEIAQELTDIYADKIKEIIVRPE